MLRLEKEVRGLGWSLSETGRRSGVNQVTVGQIVSGRFRPYPGQLEKLAGAIAEAGGADMTVDPAQLMEEVG